MNTTLNVLTKAREILANGWGKGSYARAGVEAIGNLQDPNATCFCTMGALYRAAGHDRVGWKADVDTEPAVQALGFDYHGQVLLWNDEHDRTQDEVLARFDKAIKNLA